MYWPDSGPLMDPFSSSSTSALSVYFLEGWQWISLFLLVYQGHVPSHLLPGGDLGVGGPCGPFAQEALFPVWLSSPVLASLYQVPPFPG